MSGRVCRGNDSIAEYAKWALGHKILTKEQEVELGKRISDGYMDARDELVLANLRFVVSVAVRKKAVKASIKDKVQAGNVGLIRAAEKFDHRAGVSFISYAVYWIACSIDRAGSKTSHAVDIPIRSITSLKKERRIMDEYQVSHGGREISKDLLMERAILTDAVATALLATRRNPVALDAPVGQSEESCMMDTIGDHRETHESDERRNIASLIISTATTGCDERGLDVLKMRFGLPPYAFDHTLDEIGQKYGITRERTRQIQEEELLFLRRATKRKKLLMEGKEIMRKAREQGLVSKRVGCV